MKPQDVARIISTISGNIYRYYISELINPQNNLFKAKSNQFYGRS